MMIAEMPKKVAKPVAKPVVVDGRQTRFKPVNSSNVGIWRREFDEFTERLKALEEMIAQHEITEVSFDGAAGFSEGVVDRIDRAVSEAEADIKSKVRKARRGL